MSRSDGYTMVFVDGVDPSGRVGYVCGPISGSNPMKKSNFTRFLLAAMLLGPALVGIGCGTTQRSVTAPIAPNWYDSYYYKSGHLVVPDVSDTFVVPGP